MNESHAALVDYYDAFEALLVDARRIGEYRTHFGFLDAPSSEYCFFKAITNSNQAVRIEAQAAMDRLHVELFGQGPAALRVLDVGFGCGGTLARLSREWPSSALHGINLNASQHEIARGALRDATNVTLHMADFLTHRFEQPFDLVYFIESAFHIADKAALAARLSEILTPGGRVFLVDIFYSDRLARRRPERRTNEDLFDYRSVSEWRILLADVGIELTSFEDWTMPVARHTRVATPEPEFLASYVGPALPPDSARASIFERHLLHAYHGYARLSRLLARGLLEYGIARCVKR